MQFSTKYLDMYGKETELTPEELAYFQSAADRCRRAAGVSVDIFCCDHERDVPSKHKEALGLFYTTDPQNPAQDCYITIDNYFIHECFAAEFCGDMRIEPQSLEEVICHELAHMERFRHGKSHRQLAEAYLQLANEAKKPSFAEMVQVAAERAASSQSSHSPKTREYELE